jgi:uroporphyrinogen decarboxylase
MNARERWSLLLIDELPDRPPVWPLVTSHAATVYGCDLIQYCTDGNVLAEAQLAAQRLYGHDGLAVFTDVGIIAEALGSRYHLREFDVPILDQPVVSNPDMLASLVIPDPGSSGRLPVYLTAIEKLYTAMGDMLPIFAFIPSPFTTAAGLRGIDEFLMDTITAPEVARQLLEISLAAAIRFCDECILAGALPVLVDPLASGSVISRRTFKEFALPYNRRLIEYLHRYDLDITLHICGDTSSIVDLMIETGADLFSFDRLDVQTAVDAIGEKVRLVGNIPPNGLLSSSSMDMDVACGTALKQGIANPKGFVLSTGCEVPIRCDRGRLQKMIDIGKKAGYNIEKSV